MFLECFLYMLFADHQIFSKLYNLWPRGTKKLEKPYIKDLNYYKSHATKHLISFIKPLERFDHLNRSN